MTFHSVEKAVELKNLIDHAHLYLPPIGRCLSLEKDFTADYICEEDEEDFRAGYIYHEDMKAIQKKQKQKRTAIRHSKVNSIQEKISRLYCLEGYSMSGYGFED